MNKLILFTIIFVLLIVLIIPLGLTFAIKYLPGDIQPSLTNTEKIYGKVSLSQSFISPKDNLEGIGVSIKNPNFANKNDATIGIYDERSNLIKTVVLNGKNIADGKFIKIFFDPISDSLNKRFTWSISSSDSKYEDALEIFLTDKKPSWSLGLKVGDKEVGDSLSYITLHKPNSRIEVLTTVISNWISRLTQDSTFFISYVILTVILLGSTLYFPNLNKIIRKNFFKRASS